MCAADLIVTHFIQVRVACNVLTAMALCTRASGDTLVAQVLRVVHNHTLGLSFNGSDSR